MKSVERLYKLNKFLVRASAFLAFFFFLFNLLGLWAPWHLAGFSWLFWQLPLAVIMVISVLRSLFGKGEGYGFGKRLKFLCLNLLLLLVSVLINHLAVKYFSPWGLYEHLENLYEFIAGLYW